MTTTAVPLLFLRRLRRLGALALLTGASWSCSAVKYDAGGESSTNLCSRDDECQAGGVCRANACEASSGQLDTLLLEVTPPPGATKAQGVNISGVPFIHLVSALQSRVWDEDYAIRLGSVVRLDGTVRTSVNDASCVKVQAQEGEPEAAMDGTLPARVTLVPRERLLGLSNPALSADTVLKDGSYEFSLAAPPGSYDIYVEPLGSSSGCGLSPYLVVAQEFRTSTVDLNVTLPAPDSLAVRIRWPSTADSLTGWTLDIVEREAGRRLSSQVVLRDPVPTPEGLEYLAELAFSGVSGDSQVQVAEVVRLSPPEDLVAPTLFVQRSVVELFQEGYGLIDQLKELPQPVRVKGRVNREGMTKAVAASVTLVATSLASVSAGTVAAFSRIVTTDGNGEFDVELLPGEYRVLVEASEPGLAVTEQRLTISSAYESQAGWVFEIPAQKTISGLVSDFRGRPLDAVLVQGVSPRTAAVVEGVLESARGGVEFLPRTLSASSGDDGIFELLADRGTFDVTVQPEDWSGFAWGVRLGVEVAEEDVDLGEIRLSLPQVLEGSVLDAERNPVPSARIRAYAFVADGKSISNPEDATSVVHVGEARADSKGKYRLLLPSDFK